jgi:hypothetical protein
MSLNAQTIAAKGFGFGALAIALNGFVSTVVPLNPQLIYPRRPRWQPPDERWGTDWL